MIKIYKLTTIILCFLITSVNLKAQSTVIFKDSAVLSVSNSMDVPTFDTTLGTLTNVSFNVKYINRIFPTTGIMGATWNSYAPSATASDGPCWATPNNSITVDTLEFSYNGQAIHALSTPTYAQNRNKDTAFLPAVANGGRNVLAGGFLPLISDSFTKNDYPLLPFQGDGVGKVTAAEYRDMVIMVNAGNWTCANATTAPIQGVASTFGVRVDYSVTYTYTPKTPLPVGNLTFSLSKIDNEVQLDWTALNEINLSEYIIERSSDGIVFDKLGSIEAKGELLQQKKNVYSFVDRHLPCGNILYRLRLVDHDESISYSKVRSIKNQCLFKQVVVSPNPFKDQLTIRFPTEATAEDLFSIELIDLYGRMIYKKLHSHNKIMLNDSKLNLPTSTYPSGIYFLRISNAQDVNRTFKVIKK